MNAQAAAPLTFDEAVAAYMRGEHSTAFLGFYRLAERGHTDSQYALGVMYSNGDGIPQDYGKAEHWYRRAAEQGHADAQYDLAFMYGSGTGVSRNDAEAERWYRRAAEQGHADARHNLEIMLANRPSVPRDDGDGMRRHRGQATEDAQAGVQPNVGVMQDTVDCLAYLAADAEFRKASDQYRKAEHPEPAGTASHQARRAADEARQIALTRVSTTRDEVLDAANKAKRQTIEAAERVNQRARDEFSEAADNSRRNAEAAEKVRYQELVDAIHSGDKTKEQVARAAYQQAKRDTGTQDRSSGRAPTQPAKNMNGKRRLLKTTIRTPATPLTGRIAKHGRAQTPRGSKPGRSRSVRTIR